MFDIICYKQEGFLEVLALLNLVIEGKLVQEIDQNGISKSRVVLKISEMLFSEFVASPSG